jgi:hypothetical protein
MVEEKTQFGSRTMKNGMVNARVGGGVTLGLSMAVAVLS